MSLDALLHTIGRLHPMVLHMPIGLLIGLAAWELWRAWRGPRRLGPKLGAPAVFLAWFAVLGAGGAIGTGLLHELELGDSDPTIDLHKWLSIGAGVGSLLTATLAVAARSGTSRAITRAYRTVLFLTIAALLPAGHLGGTITHGEGYLFAPLLRDPAPSDPITRARPGATPSATDPDSLALAAREIFAARCASCHGPVRARGGLRLGSEAEIIAGGREGAAAIPGDPAGSHLFQRITLPLDDRDHMPPRTRPQPTAEEIATIEAWILAWDPRSGLQPAAPPDPVAPQPAEPRAATPPLAPQAALLEPSAPAPAAIAALHDRLAHVQPIAAGSNLFWVDLSAVSGLTDADAAALLSPLQQNIADLSLARTDVTDATLTLAAGMPRLARLDLSETATTDAGVARIAGHPSLEVLVLVGTGVTDAGVEMLASMPALRRVFLWRTAVTDNALDWLSFARPELELNTGAGGAPPLETEPPIVLSPPEPGPAVASATINTACPVTGSPVDPQFTLVHEGRTIGFCCPNCPAAFEADPARFLANLPR